MIFCDFNNTGSDGVRLTCAGTLADVANRDLELRDGLRLNVGDGDLWAEVEVAWSKQDRCWVGQIVDGPFDREPGDADPPDFPA